MNFLQNISRRKLMGSAGRGAFLRALLGRTASAQILPFVDLGITRSGDELWMLDQKGRIQAVGAALVFREHGVPFAKEDRFAGRRSCKLASDRRRVIFRRGE